MGCWPILRHEEMGDFTLVREWSRQQGRVTVEPCQDKQRRWTAETFFIKCTWWEIQRYDGKSFKGMMVRDSKDSKYFIGESRTKKSLPEWAEWKSGRVHLWQATPQCNGAYLVSKRSHFNFIWGSVPTPKGRNLSWRTSRPSWSRNRSGLNLSGSSQWSGSLVRARVL